MFDALKGTRDGCLLGESIRRRPVLPGLASPRRIAVCSLDPTRPWYVWFLDSKSKISSVRPSEATGLLDALECNNDSCLLFEPVRRRSILLGPASPRLPAVRRLDPTRP